MWDAGCGAVGWFRNASRLVGWDVGAGSWGKGSGEVGEGHA